jgi:uncharacterized repeat protein (TIGR03803 family)
MDVINKLRTGLASSFRRFVERSYATRPSVSATNLRPNRFVKKAAQPLRDWDLPQRSFSMQYPCVRKATAKRLLAGAILAAATFVLAFVSEPAQAQTYKVLYNFAGGSNGYGPYGTIVSPNGTIYGAAFYDPGCACNLIFSLSSGKYTVLHRWSEPSGHNPEEPQGLLLNSNATVLYGTGAFGGPTNMNCFADAGNTCGNVFSYDLTKNQYHELYDFTGTPDGMDPAGTQILDSGSLYGLTWGGGANGWGSVYRLSLTGKEQILYSFKNSPDGQGPGDGIVPYQGVGYGITIGGGTTTCENGCGTIFKITPTGDETVLYSFTAGADGANPYQLVGDGQGNFYGLSRAQFDNVVVAVFKITASGQFSIAYNGSFASQIQSILIGPNGSLYGTASGGNSSCSPNGCGQIFQLFPTGNGNGTVNILHQFDGTDGAIPQFDSLVLHNGILVGATAEGGSANAGVIFGLKP